MHLPLSTAVASHLEFLDETGSTNDVARARAATLQHFSVVATTSQTAGRGRLGRVWVAPPGRTLAASVLVRADRAPGLEVLGWLPLAAGVAMARAVERLLASERDARRVSLKWPNDVQIDRAKVSGILTELVDDRTVIIGAGLNLELSESELPTPVSTSLALAGVESRGPALVDAALAAFIGELRAVTDEVLASADGAVPAALRDRIAAECSTIGSRVRVELPDGTSFTGVARGLDATGRLEVERDDDGIRHAVAAGDVNHLRYE